jgi:hypothetical protein
VRQGPGRRCASANGDAATSCAECGAPFLAQGPAAAAGLPGVHQLYEEFKRTLMALGKTISTLSRGGAVAQDE